MKAFTIFLTPVAWGRVKRGRDGQAYVPRKTKQFERDLATLVKLEWKAPPLSGSIKLTIRFILRPPKWPKWKDPAIRPDLDNYIKSLDGLNGVLWHDDAQITELNAKKLYDFDGGMPRIEFEIEEK